MCMKSYESFLGVGCYGGWLHLLDHEFGPYQSNQVHQHNINNLYFGEERLLTGSWDQTAHIFSFADSQLTPLKRLDGFKHAVTCLNYQMQGTNYFIFGSQDGNIKIYDENNQFAMIASFKLHDNLIRQISAYRDKVVTCSNDCTIKFTKIDDYTHTTITDNSFIYGFEIFTVDDKEFLAYSNESRHIVVYNIDNLAAPLMVQCIELPSNAWDLKFHCNRLYAGLDSGYVASFTLQSQNDLSFQEHVQNFTNDITNATANEKGSSMSEAEVLKLPLTSEVGQYVGKKEGDTKIFREGTKPLAYMWKQGAWECNTNKNNSTIFFKSPNFDIIYISECYLSLIFGIKDNVENTKLVNQLVDKHNNNLEGNKQYKFGRTPVKHYYNPKKENGDNPETEEGRNKPDKVMIYVSRSNLEIFDVANKEVVYIESPNGRKINLPDNSCVYIKETPEVIIINSYSKIKGSLDEKSNILPTRVEIENLNHIIDIEICFIIGESPRAIFCIDFDDEGGNYINIIYFDSSEYDIEELEYLVKKHLLDLYKQSPDDKGELTIEEAAKTFIKTPDGVVQYTYKELFAIDKKNILIQLIIDSLFTINTAELVKKIIEKSKYSIDIYDQYDTYSENVKVASCEILQQAQAIFARQFTSTEDRFEL